MFRSPLGKALWGVRRTVLIAGFFSLAINLLMLTAPIYMLQVFDRVLQSRSLDTLFVLSIAALFALLILAALEMVRSFLFIRLAAWLDELLGPEILSGSITQALNRQIAPNAQCLRDILTVRNFLTSPAMGSFLDAPWTPLFLLVIFSLHAMLGWVSLIGAVILLTMAFANETTTRQLLLRAGMSNFQSEALAVASVRNADVVEAMGMRSGLIELWGRERRQAGLVQGQANSRGAIIMATSKFFRFSLQIAILGVGAYLVLQDELSAGGMIAASILMGRALAPVDAAIAAWRNAVAAGAAAKRMRHQLRVTASGARQDLAIELPTPRGLLQVNDLVFGYPGQREMVIKELSFDVKPGEILGIIGPSAVGKTTLARLIVGNLAPSMGDIRLDGIALSAWAANDKGKYLGYVPQDVELFMGSVQLNIARMGPVDRDAVIAAAQAAGIHEMILAFDQGYDTEIGEAGAVLSGGQRQRIALARALYGGPKLLIYDEPNSSLDHVGDAAFTDAIKGLKAQGAAQVIISHKPGILRQTDKILILANGMAQAYGPRDQIIGGILRSQNRPSSPLTLGENGNG